MVGHRAGGATAVTFEADGISVDGEIGANGHRAGRHGEGVAVDGAGGGGEYCMVACWQIAVVGKVERGRIVGIWLAVDIGTVVVSDVAAARQGG